MGDLGGDRHAAARARGEDAGAAKEARRLERRRRADATRREEQARALTGATALVAFAGYSRSGGSIVAALMDAHPNLIVAHQVDLFEKDEIGDVTDRLAFPDRGAAMDRLFRRSEAAAADGRRGQRLRADGSDYYASYDVPGGWQGRCEDLRAIGTKNAVESALVAQRFGAAPLRALEGQVELPVRFVHVVRDPYDNIATMKREHGDRAVVRWRRRAQGVALIKHEGFPVLDVHLEDLIEDPRRELAAVCAHYGVPATAEYLDGCAAIVADRPNRTSATATWTVGEERAIESMIDEYPWLARYRRRNWRWTWRAIAGRARRRVRAVTSTA